MDNEPLTTSVARAGWDEHKFFGWDVFGDLAGRCSLTELLSLAVTGVRPASRTVAILERVAEAYTLADGRVPPLKLARIAASFGSPVLGVATAVLACDGALIGPAVSGAAARLLLEIKAQEREPEELDQWLNTAKLAGRQLPGVGIPFRKVDERIAVLLRHTSSLRPVDGIWFASYLRVDEATRRTFGVRCNVAMATASILLDEGYTPAQIEFLCMWLVLHCICANSFEAAAKQEPRMRQVPASVVRYVGQTARLSPRAQSAAALLDANEPGFKSS